MQEFGVSLHNVGELRDLDGADGRRLQRVPESVRTELNEKAQDVMYRPAGAEIRFVPADGTVSVTLSSPDGACEVFPFWGPFAANERHVLGEGPETLELEIPERPKRLVEQGDDEYAFAPSVCRLSLWGGEVAIHDISGARRPPRPDELPERAYLAYGTSITFGANATGPHLSYPRQLAERLGADVINLGCPGSAFCEAALADYAAGLDYDLATLALSVNMIAVGFTAEEFRERAEYFVGTVAAGEPDAPVAAITLFPFASDLLDGEEEGEMEATPAEYRRALREIAAGAPENVAAVEGPDLLDPAGLTTDLVHPSDRGMRRIAEGLAAELGPRL